MKLELKHLAPYLPYGLRIKTNHGFDTMATLNDWSVNGDHEHSYCYETKDETDFKPILRPLSDLTKDIEHNREKFVPERWLEENFNGICFYFDDEISIENGGTDCRGCAINSIELSILRDIDNKLFEWHFDVFGLIEKGLAIDINTLNK